jgi:hypothetical protein
VAGESGAVPVRSPITSRVSRQGCFCRAAANARAVTSARKPATSQMSRVIDVDFLLCSHGLENGDLDRTYRQQAFLTSVG